MTWFRPAERRAAGPAGTPVGPAPGAGTTRQGDSPPDETTDTAVVIDTRYTASDHSASEHSASGHTASNDVRPDTQHTDPVHTAGGSQVTAAWRGRSEVLVAVMLAVLGGLVLIEVVRMPADFIQRGPVGPKALPTLVGIGLIVVAALLAVDVLRGGHGETETGEDIDPTTSSDWRTLALLGGALLANLALVETAGWPVSGAVLFWGAAYALGSRHHLRDPLIAVALSTLTYLGLARLGVVLPGGPFEGVLAWTL